MNSDLKTDFPTIPEKEFGQRMAAMQAKMAAHGFDLVVAYSNLLDPAIVRYFADFSPINESAALVIPREGDPILCSGQACHEWSLLKSKIPDIRIMPEVGEIAGTEYEIEGQWDFKDLFNEIKARQAVKKIGIIGELIFPALIYNKLLRAFPGSEIASAERLTNEMRLTKSEHEIACMRKAAQILSRAVAYAVERLQPGDTELSLQADIESQMLKLGAESYCHAWAPMIFSGSYNSNLCMVKSSRRPIQEGEIVDISAGALYEGYNAATAVPVVLGKIPAEICQDVQIARETMSLVEAALKPGVSSRALYNLYEDHLTTIGYRQYSPYGCVHSIGMIECEGPWISGFKDVILNENSTVCIDLYFKDLLWGSFRIEETYVIRSNGPEKLTHFNEEYLKRFE